MNKKVLLGVLVLVLAGGNVGTVRRTEDPIRNTQTDGIAYQQKMEEEKDGVKGPLAYSVKYNPKENFFIELPFEKEKKSSSKGIVTEKVPSSADTAGWWEEQPTASKTVPSAETVSESPPPEPLPEAEQVKNPEAAAQPVSGAGVEKAPSGKGDDYWW